MARITLDSLSLDFPIYNSALSLRTKIVNFSTGGVLMANANKINVVRSLSNVSLDIKDGERIGLIGHNGAGKTTLLKVIAGIYHTTKGSIITEGKINAFFSTTNGIDVESTGYDNIYLIATLLGMSKKEIKSIIPSIEEFTELGSYLSMPVRTYSEGMKLRLGFAVYTSVMPEILLLDESIGAGDASFINKATRRVYDFYHKAKILILSSHSTEILEKFCHKVIWMEKGQIKLFDKTATVLKAYNENIKQQESL